MEQELVEISYKSLMAQRGMPIFEKCCRKECLEVPKCSICGYCDPFCQKHSGHVSRKIDGKIVSNDVMNYCVNDISDDVWKTITPHHYKKCCRYCFMQDYVTLRMYEEFGKEKEKRYLSVCIPREFLLAKIWNGSEAERKSFYAERKSFHLLHFVPYDVPGDFEDWNYE